MDGHHRVAGVQRHSLIVGENTYTLRTWTIAVHAELEAEIVKHRGDAVYFASQLGREVPDDFRQSVRAAAVIAQKRFKWATADDVSEFESSMAGVAWRLWASVRLDHPEIDSPSAALDIVLAMGADRLGELLTMLSIVQQQHEMAMVRWPGVGGPTQCRTPWAAIYKTLADKHHWTPAAVGELTLYQVAIYCGAFVPEHGIVSGKALRGGR